MRLTFAYDREKDIENFVKSSRSVNNRELTKEMQEYVDAYGPDFTEENLRTFIDGKLAGVDIESVLTEVRNHWTTTEDEFIRRAENIFGCVYPVEETTAYLSFNSRCTYNTSEKYFFISLPRIASAHRTVMHELFHFYTWHAFGQVIPKEKYNDIKESLTVLLNLEFADLMNGEDRGYQQHTEMRQEISRMWREGKKLNEIIGILTT